MNPLKRLAGQTMIYGLGTIVPRFLNYAILTPFYTRIFKLGEYGAFTELYAYISVFLVILTYGLETGYFRFTESNEDPRKVYSSSLISLLTTSSLFILITILFAQPIADALLYSEHKEYIIMSAVIVAIDAFTAITFAKLRKENRGLKFALIKIINTLTIVILVFFFLYFAPAIYKKNPEGLIGYVYSPGRGLDYVFIANIIGSGLTLLLLLSEMIRVSWKFSWVLMKKILVYSLPLLIAGLAGMLNEALDKLLLKHLLRDPATALDQLGLYGANYRIAVFMTIFIQMFRYAAEPFFFTESKRKDARQLYAIVMKYFVLSALLIFLGIMLYIDIVKYFIGNKGSAYWKGLDIVPVVLIANLFYGIYLNQSVWYKLTDMTKYGAILTVIGLGVTVFVNVVFIPRFGYHASAWGHFFCYLVMNVFSFGWGQKYFKIPYNMKRLFFYIFTALGMYGISRIYADLNNFLELAMNTGLIIIFLAIVYFLEDLKKDLIIEEAK